jgi:hypothetical protein
MPATRIDTLTATVDQLQAEVDRLTFELARVAVIGMLLAFSVLLLGWRLWHD